jgi:predicted AlkP superfamily pyrophosphatase or phosphodiesterase
MPYPYTRPSRVGRMISYLAFFALFFLSIRGPVGSAPRRAAADVTNRSLTSRPHLILLIVVDQFRYDYIDRFGDLFGEKGIRRLLKSGASWTDANYDHIPTYTAPGHSTLMTGAWPSETGIVANNWFEGSTKCEPGSRVQKVSSVSDPASKPLGADRDEDEDAQSSPSRLMVSTLGDELRLASNSSKVIGISIKARSAILTTGRHATAAYWFNNRTGAMVSSTYYFSALPRWVTSFNERRLANTYCNREWTSLMPGEAHRTWEAARVPTKAELPSRCGEFGVFPHHVVCNDPKTPYEEIGYSPFSNDLLVSFAKEAIDREKLGRRGVTDILTLSFSANDYVGHRYGPYSQEVMDMTLRVDGQIASLLDFLDDQGLRDTLVVLTADHGMAPIPEHASRTSLIGDNGGGEAGARANRAVPCQAACDGGAGFNGRICGDILLDYVEKAIVARYQSNNASSYIQTIGVGKDRLRCLINGNIYFDREALKRDKVELEEIERIAGEAALKVCGVSRYFTREQLMRGAIPPSDAIARRVLHGFYPCRSGDVVIVTQPFTYLTAPGDKVDCATHGSPYSYDTHVPLIIMGKGVAPGRYGQAATPADLAPTLAVILGIQAPSNSMGRILTEGIAAQDEER